MNINIRKLIYLSAIIITILIAVYLVVTKAPVFADTLRSGGNLSTDTYQLPLESTGKTAKLTLTAKELAANQINFYLKIEHWWEKEPEVKLSGFEKQASLNDHLPFNKNDYLAIIGEVGAHSKNLQIVKASNDLLTIMPFQKNGERVESISSDLPLFEYSKSQNLDITVYFRDYEKDPLVDYNADIYRLDGDVFSYYQSKSGSFPVENIDTITSGGIK